jgi:hypothetical protein
MDGGRLHLLKQRTSTITLVKPDRMAFWQIADWRRGPDA